MARILIVDDEAHIRTLLRRFLEREGHECEMATSADEAWERLANGAFELVLSDVNMPGTSGLELAPRIAEEYPQTPVVMVTGVDDPEVATKAVEAEGLPPFSEVLFDRSVPTYRRLLRRAADVG